MQRTKMKWNNQDSAARTAMRYRFMVTKQQAVEEMIAS